MKKKLPSAPFLPWLGVFETLRVERGCALFADEHWDSLRTAAKALGLRVTRNFRREAVALPPASGRLRWIVEAQRQYTLFTPDDEPVKSAFHLAVAPQRIGSANWDAQYKTLSYLTHWQARRWVKADEALLLNEHGIVASGAMTNLFWVRKGKVFTPSTRAGCRAGVVRGWVLRRLKVKEGLFLPSELEKADEIFLTNSWIGLCPVRQFGRRRFHPGPVTLDLQRKLAARWTADCARRGGVRSASGSTGFPSSPD